MTSPRQVNDYSLTHDFIRLLRLVVVLCAEGGKTAGPVYNRIGALKFNLIVVGW